MITREIKTTVNPWLRWQCGEIRERITEHSGRPDIHIPEKVGIFLCLGFGVTQERAEKMAAKALIVEKK